MSRPSSTRQASSERRLRRYVYAVVLASVPVAAGSLALTATSLPGRHSLIGILVFLAIAVVAELEPVPVDDTGETVSLAFVFILASQILFGWPIAVVSAMVCSAVVHLWERRPFMRSAFNVATYALAAFASALPGLALGIHAGAAVTSDATRLTLLAFAGGAAYVVTNVFLVAGAISLDSGLPLRGLFESNARHSGPAFVIMAFIAALAASLWPLSPGLELLLAGPLLALALYQRYAYRTVLAVRDAGTDALTMLGNHRSFQADLGDALTVAETQDTPVALAIVDIDDFKSVNDRFGHPAGDVVLAQIATCLREEFGASSAYRTGGEEFAVVLAGASVAQAERALERLHRRLEAISFPHGEDVTVSVGIAGVPESATDRQALIEAADGALYWSKTHGKSRSCVYNPAVVRIYSAEELALRAERAARLRAAESLIRVVDAKDTYARAHSQSVSRLAESIARALELDEETVDQVRLAGLLHDLGKIATPDRILQKPGKLDPEELRVMREHAELGYRLVEGLGISPVDRWIRHHHEWWDGSGYPHGLAGEDIPLGSRIILVADAFDAMTSDRVYRKGRGAAEAVVELRRRAWSQFDARIVAALERHLAAEAADAAASLRESA